MTTQADPALRQHMFALAPLRVWLRLLREHGGVAPRRRGALARILLTSLGTLPLRLAESAIHGRRVRRTPIETPPVMILGYGRSGTTHLHNLLVCDPDHAGVTTYQAIAPACCLVGRRFLEPLIARQLPAKRPMDNMDVSLDLPQEEEIAIAGLSHQSFLHHLSFPRAARRCYDRYAAMQGLTPREIERWERTYLDVVRKATVIAGGRRLVLKSPSNLARVPHILRLFPGAKFVHIVRNPYVVY
ncbi:MAG: sulfotransferase, partial [Acidobacteria bacterium]|nr:sulfotransferase [Acidobacteriota bacterium]